MAASAGGAVSSVDRSRQMGSVGLGGGQTGGSRDRSSDSNGHNTDDDTVLSGAEDDENANADHNGQGDGKTKARKKKTRTVFSRSQVRILYFRANFFNFWART